MLFSSNMGILPSICRCSPTRKALCTLNDSVVSFMLCLPSPSLFCLVPSSSVFRSCVAPNAWVKACHVTNHESCVKNRMWSPPRIVDCYTTLQQYRTTESLCCTATRTKQRRGSLYYNTRGLEKNEGYLHF